MSAWVRGGLGLGLGYAGGGNGPFVAIRDGVGCQVHCCVGCASNERVSWWMGWMEVVSVPMYGGNGTVETLGELGVWMLTDAFWLWGLGSGSRGGAVVQRWEGKAGRAGSGARALGVEKRGAATSPRLSCLGPRAATVQ